MVRIEPSLTGTIEGDENVERGNWSRQLDFLLSCIGYAVGLGNVWRFPYLSYSNGGGAFFIPYFIMLVFVGMPVFFLELYLGQFSSRGPIGAYKFSPLFKGAAVGMVLVSATVSTYYGVIIAWAIFYLFASFTNELPWSKCDPSWSTKYCSLNTPDMSIDNCMRNTSRFADGFCQDAGGEIIGIWNSSLAEKAGFKRVMSASEYYKRRVLRESAGIEHIGGVSWELALCLIATWILVYVSLYKGVKSSGKVVYFTALFPYVVLIILFFRGVTLPGASKGIIYYITPEFHRLAEPEVWRDAAGQIFFSLSNCWGGLIALSSYNRFRNNIFRDTMIVSLGNCGTSVFAGFVIYSYIGNLAHTMNTRVEDVSQDGAGLAFVIYPMAVLNLPVPPLWAILFFIMLITLGLDTQFTLIETVATTIFDAFPNLIPKKNQVVALACLLFFLPGLIYVTQGGNYILKVVDSFASGWNILIICIIEITVVSYIYGYDRFSKDVKVMIGRTPPLFWRICLQGLSQAILTFVLIFDWVKFKPLKYGNYEFPLWANAIGWIISVYVVLPIPIMAIYKLCHTKGTTCSEKLAEAVRPTYDWGPALPKHRMYIDYVPNWQVHPIGERRSMGSEVLAAKDLELRKSIAMKRESIPVADSAGDLEVGPGAGE